MEPLRAPVGVAAMRLGGKHPEQVGVRGPGDGAELTAMRLAGDAQNSRGQHGRDLGESLTAMRLGGKRPEDGYRVLG